MAADKSTSRIIVACPHCKARFDVTNFKPGSKIRCGSCRNILRIPDRTGEASVTPPSVSVGPSRPPSRPAEAGPAPPRPPAQPSGAAKEPGVGTRVNNEFELLRLLGQGGYGSVYEAVDISLKRRVAIKLMLREKTTKKEFVEKFLREARTAAKLSHPNIVKIHHVGFCRELQQHFLSMEFVEGRTLSEIMSQEGAFPVDRAIEVITQSANGLAAAHQKNIIHRDIKPGNIMITTKGVVKIADFGLAKIYDPSEKESTIIGTPYFMPPEQFEGKARDGRCDIYSLGVTFYYMLTLKRPFDGRTPAEVLMNVMRTDPVPVRNYVPTVPEALEKILAKMMARKVDDRFSSCEELLRALRAIRGDEVAEEKVFCTSCGFGNDLGAERCAECSSSLLTPCPLCSAPDFIVAKFCGSCGANLEREREVAGLLREAESYVASGRYAEAAAKLSAARGLSPENAQVLDGLRRTEQASAERESAVARLRALMAAGDYARALPLAAEAGDKFPDYDPVTELVRRARDGARERGIEMPVPEVKVATPTGDLGEDSRTTRRTPTAEVIPADVKPPPPPPPPPVDPSVKTRERAMRLEAERRLEDALAAWKETLALKPGDEAAAQSVSRLEALFAQVERLRAGAEEALAVRDLARARSALEGASALLPDAPAVCALFDRLRAEERDLAGGIASALAHLSDGRPTDAAAVLAELGRRFPQEPGLPDAAERARKTAETVSVFLEESVRHLAAHMPDLAREYVRAAQRLAPADPRLPQSLARCDAETAAIGDSLTKARALLEASDAAAAVALLAPLGGETSRLDGVVALARQAGDRLRRASQPAAPGPREETIETALRSARELLVTGQVQGALAACQKALRVDRNHDGARALKAKIDALITRASSGQADSSIETAFYTPGHKGGGKDGT